MSFGGMFVLMLAATESVIVADGPVVAPVPKAAIERPDELRAAYADAVRRSARKEHPNPFTVAPQLVNLYRQLDSDRSLAHTERSKMQRGLKFRLESLRDRLLRDALAQKRQQQRNEFRARRAGRISKPGDSAGGGEIANAVELIELIQNTIAPDTWDVNGGNGSISYFRLLKVLVVRQTGEVHHQIGNGLSKLKQ
jgi:hypothetical protein